MSDIFHPKYLNNQKSDRLSRQPQDVSFIDSSQLLTSGEPNMPGTQPDQIDGSNDRYLSQKIFTHTSNNSHSYLFFDLLKPPKFDDPLCDVGGTHQEIEAIKLLLSVISSSHNPYEIPKTSQTRVSQIRVSEMTVPTYHTPLSIIALDVSSFGQAFHSSHVPLSTYVYPLTAGMQ